MGMAGMVASLAGEMFARYEIDEVNLEN